MIFNHHWPARLAHDIQSPLAVIELCGAEIFGNNHPKIKIIKNSIKTVTSIVENVLQKYIQYNVSMSEFDDVKSYILINELIIEIVEQKQMEWNQYNKKINLTCDLTRLNWTTCWVFLSAVEFKRHISNLLNNSVDAIRGDYLEIKITASNINDFICILIKDNGIGMDDAQITEIKLGKSFKHNGHGIGLKSAISYFKNEGGMVEISSLQNHWTAIEIYLKLQQAPSWFSNIIYIHKNLIIIDDDDNILLYWSEKLKGTDRNIVTLSSPEQFKEWYQSSISKPHYTFFVDYDFGNEVTGIDIIKEINCYDNCYLITSGYSDISIQEQANKLHFKIIPKYLLSSIAVVLKDSQ